MTPTVQPTSSERRAQILAYLRADLRADLRALTAELERDKRDRAIRAGRQLPITDREVTLAQEGADDLAARIARAQRRKAKRLAREQAADPRPHVEPIDLDNLGNP